MKKKKIERKEDILNELKKNCNGFLLSENAGNLVYDPCAIQSYFQNNGEIELYFPNNESNKTLYDFLKTQFIGKLTDFLRHILDEEQNISICKDDLMRQHDWQLLQNNFYQFAFDDGYLTLEKTDNMWFLKTANQKTRENFSLLFNQYFFRNQNYSKLLVTLQKRDFQKFFSIFEEIVFQNNSVLNLKSRNKLTLEEFSESEIFLHQACSLLLKEMLIYAKKLKLIRDYEFQIEKKIPFHSEGLC